MQNKYSIRKFSYYAHLIGVIFICIMAFAILFIPEGPTVQKADLWVLICFFLLTIYGVYMFIKMPQHIELISDNSISFKSFTKEIQIDTNDLLEIYTESMGYYVIFKCKNLPFKILNRVDGLYELVSFLKSKNETIKVKGL